MYNSRSNNVRIIVRITVGLISAIAVLIVDIFVGMIAIVCKIVDRIVGTTVGIVWVICIMVGLTYIYIYT